MGTVKFVKNLQCPCGSGLKHKHCCWGSGRLGEPAEKKMARHSFLEQEENTGRLGFADAITAYAEPLLEKAGKDDAGIQKALTLAGIFWNIAQLKEDQRKKEIEDIARKLSADKEDNAAFHEMAGFMLDRYERMFGKKQSPVCPDCGGPLEAHRSKTFRVISFLSSPLRFLFRFFKPLRMFFPAAIRKIFRRRTPS